MQCTIKELEEEISGIENQKTNHLNQFKKVDEETCFILGDSENKKKQKEDLNNEIEQLKNQIEGQ